MKLTENIMFIRLSYGLPRQSRKVQAEADVDQRRLRASTRLYSGKAFSAIRSADAQTRLDLTRLAIQVPAALSSTYVLPAGMLDRVRDLIEDARRRRANLIDIFLLQEYAQEREAARNELRGSFRESDFPEPEILKDQFRMETFIFRLDVPDGLPSDVLEAERTKFAATLDDVASQCRSALRETLCELVGHLAEVLTPGPDGSRKKLYSSSIDKLRDFLDTVNARDITSDTAIRDLSAKAKAIIGDVTTEALKKNVNLADNMKARLSAVKAEIDAVIVRDGGRQIDLDLE